MSAAAAPRCLLDTHVVLDWVLFDDPRCRVWADAVQQGALRWIHTAGMLDEALRVVHYPALARRHDPATSVARVRQCFASWSECRPVAPLQPALQCSDADDQMFVDLALQHGARWLLTRDHALLRLARPAAARGLRIVRPESDAPAAG